MLRPCLGTGVHEMLGALRPRVYVAAVCTCPEMTPQVYEQLTQLGQALRADCVNPLDTVLEPYSHVVLRLGTCQLFPADHCRPRRVRSYHLCVYFEALFRAAARMSNSRLSRYDLHHAHLYYNYSTHVLGMVFHAREYPAFDDPSFPFSLGYCQTGSDLCLASGDEMENRTVLWTFGDEHMVLIEAPDRWPFGTIYESEFGRAIADVYFFESRFGNKEECLNRGLHVVTFT